MAELIAELTNRYEHVVIDAPPVLGIADAPVLASQVEGAVRALPGPDPTDRRGKGGLQ